MQDIDISKKLKMKKDDIEFISKVEQSIDHNTNLELLINYLRPPF